MDYKTQNWIFEMLQAYLLLHKTNVLAMQCGFFLFTTLFTSLAHELPPQCHLQWLHRWPTKDLITVGGLQYRQHLHRSCSAYWRNPKRSRPLENRRSTPTSEAGILRYRRVLAIRGCRYDISVCSLLCEEPLGAAVKLSGIRSWIGGEQSYSSISSRSPVGAVM